MDWYHSVVREHVWYVSEPLSHACGRLSNFWKVLLYRTGRLTWEASQSIQSQKTQPRQKAFWLCLSCTRLLKTQYGNRNHEHPPSVSQAGYFKILGSVIPLSQTLRYAQGVRSLTKHESNYLRVWRWNKRTFRKIEKLTYLIRSRNGESAAVSWVWIQKK